MERPVGVAVRIVGTCPIERREVILDRHLGEGACRNEGNCADPGDLEPGGQGKNIEPRRRRRCAPAPDRAFIHQVEGAPRVGHVSFGRDILLGGSVEIDMSKAVP